MSTTSAELLEAANAALAEPLNDVLLDKLMARIKTVDVHNPPFTAFNYALAVGEHITELRELKLQIERAISATPGV